MFLAFLHSRDLPLETSVAFTPKTPVNSLHHWEKPQTISELRSFVGFCNYYSAYVRMYAELSGPLHNMLQVGKFDGRKGSKKKLA